MKNREKELLFQLLKNSKLSDREIAKKLKTSQSTITRNRHRLEKNIIVSYAGIPNMQKLGIKLIAFTFGRCVNSSSESEKKLNSFRENMSNVIFSGYGEGMGKTMIIVSLHDDFTDYTTFMGNLRQTFSGCYEDLESFFVPTGGFAKTLNFSKAVEHLINRMGNSEIMK